MRMFWATQRTKLVVDAGVTALTAVWKLARLLCGGQTRAAAAACRGGTTHGGLMFWPLKTILDSSMATLE